MLEIYHIYECFIHLNMVGKLRTSFSFVSDWSEEKNDDKLSICFSASLNDEELGHIQHFYRQTNAGCDSLCHRYNDKKDKAMKRHKLGSFLPIDNWTPSSGYPLSKKEILICLEPSRQMHIMNIFNYEVSK